LRACGLRKKSLDICATIQQEKRKEGINKDAPAKCFTKGMRLAYKRTEDDDVQGSTT